MDTRHEGGIHGAGFARRPGHKRGVEVDALIDRVSTPFGCADPVRVLARKGASVGRCSETPKDKGRRTLDSLESIGLPTT
jgi:hypothetical protein